MYSIFEIRIENGSVFELLEYKALRVRFCDPQDEVLFFKSKNQTNKKINISLLFPYS